MTGFPLRLPHMELVGHGYAGLRVNIAGKCNRNIDSQYVKLGFMSV